MNRRIRVRTAGRPTPDGGGGFTPGDPSEFECWAKAEPLEGDEQLRAMQLGMQRPHRFTTSYRRDLAASQDIVYGARTFDVKSVVDTEERHDELVILADEVVDA